MFFGSVTNIQIAEELQKLGFELDRKIIHIKKSVKEVGSYDCQVRLHREVIVPVLFDVVSENHEILEQEEKESVTEEVVLTEESPVTEEDINA